MNRQEVLSKLCELCTTVSHNAFDYQHASDCFCDPNRYDRKSSFQFDETVLTFIQDAVHEKIKQHKRATMNQTQTDALANMYEIMTGLKTQVHQMTMQTEALQRNISVFERHMSHQKQNETCKDS